MPRIGVAISTQNRREILEESVLQWLKHKPNDCEIVVVDDASEDPVPDYLGVKVVRNNLRLGIAMTKNRGIEELMNLGCEHLFLADDDVYPIRSDWWKPYVESRERHLSYQWPRGSRWRVLHRDSNHFSISFPRGVMLYADKKVIESVGGFDPSFGRWGGEHVEWSRRIHKENLSTWEFADVSGSERYWYAHDRVSNTTNSTIPLAERVKLDKYSKAQRNRLRDCGNYVPYRQQPEGFQDYSLGPDLAAAHAGEVEPSLAVLLHVLLMNPYGQAVEFGVGSGRSLAQIATHMPVMGFDSFEGLPERWRDGFDKGAFACKPPSIENSTLVEGWFEESLPRTDLPDDIGLVHIDCDLYSSTKTVLSHLKSKIHPGCYIVFDEWHGYSSGEDGNEPENHEQRAWREFVAETDISWTVVGHGPEQWAIRII